MKFKVFHEYTEDENSFYIGHDIEGVEEKIIEIDPMNTDKDFYKEKLIPCVVDKYGDDLEDYEEIKNRIKALIHEYGNIGCSDMKHDEQLTPVIHTQTYKIRGATIKVPISAGLNTKTSNWHRRQPSKRVNGAFEVHPDLLGHNLNQDGLAYTIFLLKELTNRFANNEHIELDELNKQLIECNVTEILTTNEKGSIIPSVYVDNLLGLAFWQLKRDILENRKLEICLECGRYFTKRVHNAKYCNENCTTKYTTNKFRAKKMWLKDCSVEEITKKRKRPASEVEGWIADWEKVVQ